MKNNYSDFTFCWRHFLGKTEITGKLEIPLRSRTNGFTCNVYCLWTIYFRAPTVFSTVHTKIFLHFTFFFYSSKLMVMRIQYGTLVAKTNYDHYGEVTLVAPMASFSWLIPLKKTEWKRPNWSYWKFAKMLATKAFPFWF